MMLLKIAVTTALLALMPIILLASDQENCLMCHKYSGMGRYEKGAGGIKKRIFYIPEEIHKNSVHGKLRCKDCHVGVDRIPHTGVEKVDCSKNCHLNDPSSGKEFSHKKIVDSLNMSVHGAEGTKNPKFKDDLPTCLYCHSNPLYNTASESHLSYLNICIQCHENPEWAKRFLRHQFYRMSTRRSSKDVVALCGSCHENRKMMGRHNLDPVVGFKDTYHGKAITYGTEDVANCLNCHAPRGLGLSPHSIVSKTDAKSSVNAENRVKTCRNEGGVGTCHPAATEKFALGRKSIHPSGFNELLTSGPRQVSLSADKDGADGERVVSEAFHYKVVYWINTVYKILIGAVVGGMITHQVLDFIATARERRREREAGGIHGSH